MVFALSVPVCINQTISSSSRGSWPVAQCRVDLGPGRRVMIRCSLSMPGRCSMPGSPTSPRSFWFGSSSPVYKEFFRTAWSTMLHNHRVWSEKSLQTLQRVGTLLRSTSKDCIAALASKKDSVKKPVSNPDQPPESEPPSAGQLKASLSRFITTASNAELQQAAMLADLSNLAYDVAAIDHQQLQARHGLTVVAHSRPSGAFNVEAEAVVSASSEAQTFTQQHLPSLEEAFVNKFPEADEHNCAGTAYAYSGAVPAASPVCDAAGQQLSAFPHSTDKSHSGMRSAPASPRTPLVLSSFGESEDLVPSSYNMQYATAAAAVPDPDTPKRKSSALAAASRPMPTGSSSRAVAPAAAAMAEPAIATLNSSPSGSHGSPAVAGAVLAGQMMQYQQHGLLESVQHEHDVSLDQKEQEALAHLQQQEQAILLEMQQQQQLQMLLQQEQEIMHQFQQQSSNDSCQTPASSTAWWWWWQQQQQQQQQAVSAADPDVPSRDSQAELHPTDWFLCDEAAGAEADSPTRYIVIQGSITLDHWRINLTIDPCEFEGGALGHIKVHRGVYEAALEMLDTFVPYVQEHLARHPNGKIAFTGHSLGGSLATLLMLLMVHRGILPAANVATVRTFGAPAIFCEGATGSAPAAGACKSCSLPCQHRAEDNASSAIAGSSTNHTHGAGGLLDRLGLSPESVVNVVMTRDIVPRAFVCDYTLVADVLKSWLPSFKEHAGLASCRDHKALYNFVGTVEVLQPDVECPFVLPGEAHSMLPEQPALYKLTEPCCHLPGKSGDSAVVVAPAAGSSPMTSATTEEGVQDIQLSDKAATLKQLEGLVVAACASCSRSSCSGCTAGAAGTAQDSQEQVTAGFTFEGNSKCATAAGACSVSGDSMPGSPQCATSEGSNNKTSKLRGLGSWGSLVSLGHLSLTTAIADLTSTFTLVSSNSGMVNIPSDAAAAADTSDVQQAASVLAEGARKGEADAAGPAVGDAVDAFKSQAPVEAAGAHDLLGMTLGDAILTFMNSPHPLETLGEMRAYGPAGSISRFHNPYNYTVALQQLCKPVKKLSELQVGVLCVGGEGSSDAPEHLQRS